jgi:hypothetical protein
VNDVSKQQRGSFFRQREFILGVFDLMDEGDKERWDRVILFFMLFD